MPSKITNFLHDSFVEPPVAPALGTAFATADVHVHDMAATLPAFQKAGNFSGIVEGIHVRLTNLAGGATKVTIRVCLDPNLDVSIVTDTTADLAIGVTTATDGCAAFAVGIPISFFGMFIFAPNFLTINVISLFGMILVIGILVPEGQAALTSTTSGT